MYLCITGTVTFNHRLSNNEMRKMQEDLDKERLFSEVGHNDIYLFDAPDISEEISGWLKRNGNDVKEGCVIEYYGDYDGAFRYQNGQWYESEAQSLFVVSDKELIDELEYRRLYANKKGDNV